MKQRRDPPIAIELTVEGIGSGENATDARLAAAYIPEPMLFHLTNDPNEEANVIAQLPEKATALEALLESLSLGEKSGRCSLSVWRLSGASSRFS